MLPHTTAFTMSVDFADIDRDGWDDLVLMDMLDPRRRWRMTQANAVEPAPADESTPQYSRNVLLLNRGDGTYADIAHFAGVAATGWSWSAVFLDVDLDGYEDLLVTTGSLFDPQDLDTAEALEREGAARRDRIPQKLLRFPRLPLPNVALRNLGNRRFADMSRQWGFHESGFSHGMALGDLDGDGDADVVVNHLNAPAGVYRNETGAARVAVRLEGAAMNTAEIGARVTLIAGSMAQSQEILAGGRYVSSDAPERAFAWPPGARSGELRVSWPDGTETRVEGVGPNERHTIRQPPRSVAPGDATASRRPASRAVRPLFQQVPLAHHHERPRREDSQGILPWRLDRHGPAAAWTDLDRDGWPDLVVTGGAGRGLAAFRNERGRRFRPWTVLTNAGFECITSVIPDPRDSSRLLVAISEPEQDSVLLSVDVSTASVRPLLRAGTVEFGTMAAADHDGDGDLDLFVAGRAVPGRYPDPATSFLLRNDGGDLRPDAIGGAALRRVGLVSGATWTDLDGNGLPELVIACEWGPLRVFRRERGALRPWDPPVRGGPLPGEPLSRLTGWWTTVVSGDFDGDGRPDLLAGNHGRNNPFHASARAPQRLYHGDFDGDGSKDVLHVEWDPHSASGDAGAGRSPPFAAATASDTNTIRIEGREVPVPNLLELRAALPSVAVRFPSHAAYGEAQLRDLALADAECLEVVMLESVLFLNRGDHFVCVPLPDEAQWSPVMGAAVADFDGDGSQDVFLAQNFFGVRPSASRYDAGRGLLLLGDGVGGWRRAPAGGVSLAGEQRGCAVADFDRDGWPDLVVGQINAPTALFRNTGRRGP